MNVGDKEMIGQAWLAKDTDEATLEAWSVECLERVAKLCDADVVQQAIVAVRGQAPEAARSVVAERAWNVHAWKVERDSCGPEAAVLLAAGHLADGHDPLRVARNAACAVFAEAYEEAWMVVQDQELAVQAADYAYTDELRWQLNRLRQMRRGQ